MTNTRATVAAMTATVDHGPDTATTRARARTRSKLAADGYERNGRTITFTEEWLEQLRHTDTASDEDRGHAVLSAASAIHNVKSANVVDFLRWLLDTAAWRSFTYPDGSHFEFREREFDYFIALIDFDPRIANEAARSTGANDVLVAMAEASLTPLRWSPHDVGPRPRPQGGHAAPPDRSKRRSVDEIVANYPAIGPWLDKYGLRALGAPKLHDSERTRSGVRAGKSVGQVNGSRRWQASVSGDADLAEAIAAKLIRDGLADDVYRALDADRVRTRRAEKRSTTKRDQDNAEQQDRGSRGSK